MKTILSNILLAEIQSEAKLELDSTILDYKELATLEDPIFWLSIGLFTCLMSGLIFADLMKTKLNNWKDKKISPLPLNNPRTVSSWIAFFSGLSIIFTSVLSIVNFSSIKSLIFAIIVSVLFAIVMWNATKDLFNQVDNGTIKEIDNFL